MAFQKATKRAAKLRLALIGPAGAGKSYTALRIAQGLSGPIAAIDTERGSLSKYSHVTDFDVLELDSFSVEKYISGIREAEQGGYNVLIIDSLSHAWAGKDGILEFVDKRKAQSRGNDFGVWRDATPLQNSLVDAILTSKCHIICTMRSKMEYVIEKDEKTGKNVPRKVGLQPVQRDQIEFEFDLVGDLDQDHKFVVTKSRIDFLADEVIVKPGPDLGQRVLNWLNDGAPVQEKPIAPAEPETFAQLGAKVFNERPLAEKADWLSDARTFMTERDWKFITIPAFKGEGEMKLKLQGWGISQQEQGNDPLTEFKKLAEEAHKEGALA